MMEPGIYSGQIRIAITDGRELNIDFNSRMTPDEISDKISEYSRKDLAYYQRGKYKYGYFSEESSKRRSEELSYWLYLDLSCNEHGVRFPPGTASEQSIFSAFIGVLDFRVKNSDFEVFKPLAKSFFPCATIDRDLYATWLAKEPEKAPKVFYV
uniref:Uncharacterized protein n=1 Tax=Romanomermis culicivorax TaxID=13658 RepID=A0A915HVF2_ROMCU